MRGVLTVMLDSGRLSPLAAIAEIRGLEHEMTGQLEKSPAYKAH